MFAICVAGMGSTFSISLLEAWTEISDDWACLACLLAGAK
jgi:hypothetical protein